MNEPIKTARTLLRKYTDEDREIVADYFTDELVGRYMGDGPSDTRKDAYSLFDKCFEIYDGLYPNRHFEMWGIELNGGLIGHLELKEGENTNEGELEVVYLLDQEYWGKGIVVEILNKLLDYVKGLNKRIIATVKTRNHQSIRVLEKVGIEKKSILQMDKNVLKIWLKTN